MNLVQFPRAFPLIAMHRGKPLHCRSYGSYMIFYRIDATQVSVVTVAHAARDPQRWFRSR